MSDWPRTGVYQFDGPTRCHLAFTRSLAYAPPHQVIARYVRCTPPRSQPEISWLNAIIARVSINYVAVFKWPVSDRARKLVSARPLPHNRHIATALLVVRRYRDWSSTSFSTPFIIFHRSVLWKRIKRDKNWMEWMERRIDSSRIFSSFLFLHATFLDERMWFFFF